MRWRHRVDLPAQVREALDLARGERVLAVATCPPATVQVATGPAVTAATAHVVATGAALYVPAPDRSSFRRLAYESILRVSWDADTSTLTVVLPDPDGGRLELPLVEPGFLPETVRERVQNTILYSQHVPLRGGKGVLVSARRRPGTSQAQWTLVFDAGLDGTEPALRERAERTVEELRARTGI